MSTLLYIHGFLSSPNSEKAILVKRWLSENRPDLSYSCPFLTPYPHQTRQSLENIVENAIQVTSSTVFLMGSSLGGFWATWLAEKYNLKAVLINPAVKLSLFNQGYINAPLKNYHTEDTYELTEQDIDGYRQVNIETITRPENYFIMLQTGDEVLDYRLALEKYSGCRDLVEEGGDHSFSNFETKIEQAMKFLVS